MGNGDMANCRCLESLLDEPPQNFPATRQNYTNTNITDFPINRGKESTDLPTKQAGNCMVTSSTYRSPGSQTQTPFIVVLI